MYIHEPQKVVTKNGECEITLRLVLAINLNSGNVNISSGKVVEQLKEESESDTVDWAIPEFQSERIEFGKKVEE